MDDATIFFWRVTIAFAIEIVCILAVAPRITRWWLRKHMASDYNELLRPMLQQDLGKVLVDADERIQKGRAEVAQMQQQALAQLQQQAAQLEKNGLPIQAAASQLGQQSGEARAMKKIQTAEAEANLVEQFGEGWLLFKKILPTEAREMVGLGDAAVPIIAKWLRGLQGSQPGAAASAPQGNGQVRGW